MLSACPFFFSNFCPCHLLALINTLCHSIFLCISLKVYILYLHIVVKFIKKFIPCILCTILTLINKLILLLGNIWFLEQFKYLHIFICLLSIRLPIYQCLHTHTFTLSSLGECIIFFDTSFFKDVIHHVSYSVQAFFFFFKGNKINNSVIKSLLPKVIFFFTLLFADTLLTVIGHCLFPFTFCLWDNSWYLHGEVVITLVCFVLCFS